MKMFDTGWVFLETFLYFWQPALAGVCACVDLRPNRDEAGADSFLGITQVHTQSCLVIEWC